MEYYKVEKKLGNLVSDNVKKLENIFPSVVKDGEVDFEELRKLLGDFEEVDKERYEMNWVGKSEAKKIALEPLYGKTLKYIEGDGKNEDTTKNLYIEGDNLEVLKLLQNSYYGKVKMIYIDPPYNTGNDFIYNDSFKENIIESEIIEGSRNEYGERLIKNQRGSSYYHSKWMSMIYSRLILSKNLLKDDGVIFISIDNNEYVNLKKICDEIFGEENFITNLIWQKKTGASDAVGIANITEDILIYIKDISYTSQVFTRNKNSYDLDRYKYNDKFSDKRGPYYLDTLDRGGLQYSDSLNYFIECPDGSKTYPNGRSEFINDGWIWKWSKQKVEWAIENGFLEFRKSTKKKSGWSVCYKNYLLVDNEGNVIDRSAPHKNIINNILNANAASDMKSIFGDNIFKYSKPKELIEKLLSFVKIEDGDIILDFFSGSATTAHAVINFNYLNNLRSKFIMVQLPELTNIIRENNKYKNICEIGKERIRRSGDKIIEDNKNDSQIKNLDVGFKVFRVGNSNIKWENRINEDSQFKYNLDGKSIDDIDFMPNTKDIDVVYEILLRHYGIPLTAKINKLDFIGDRTYTIEDSIIVCLETIITQDIIDKISELEPIKVIFRDSAFGDDISLKQNSIHRLNVLIEKNNKNTTHVVEFI